MSIKKPIGEISEPDLQNLITEQEAESRAIDYKVILNLDVDKGREDFRKDVAAFANSAGGDLVIGMRDENGIPVDLSGFSLGSSSQEQYRLRLLDILQSRIKPRIQGVEIRPLQLANKEWAAIVRVPRSFARPHQVEIGNKDFQFWFRHDGGNQRMDIDEIRDSILGTTSLADRIRQFRAERIGNIISGETPIPMAPGPKIILHLIPFASMATPPVYDLSKFGQGPLQHLMPIREGLDTFRHNFDGFLTTCAGIDPRQPNSYLQIYRSGIIEAVDGLIGFYGQEQRIFPATFAENEILKAIKRFLNIQKDLEVTTPLALSVSLVGVMGYRITPSNTYSFFAGGLTPIDRDVLNIPEVLLEGYDGKPYSFMRPIFDAIWNASGFAACPNYNELGVWQA